ncbi:MAG: hypothetical protein PHU45_02815 [Bacilli bacterium]|nr:hypothetical protein [Bacilli bacterium]
MKTNQKFLCVLFILTFALIGIVNAEEHTFNLTYSSFNSFSGAISGGTFSSYVQPVSLYVNFNAVTNPKYLIVYAGDQNDIQTAKSGTFIGKIGTTEICSGVWSYSHGDFGAYGTGIGQLFYTFNTWLPNGYTGYQHITITYSGDTIPTYTFSRSVSSSGSLPLAFAGNYGYSAESYLTNSKYVMDDNLYSTNGFYTSDNDGSDIVTTTITKSFNGNLYPSKITIYSNTGIVYSDTGYDSSTKTITLQDKPLIFQASLLNGLSIQNSSKYFDLPLNIYSVSYSPTNPAPNQDIRAIIASTNLSAGGSTLSEIYYINCDVYNSNHELINNKISSTYPYGFNFLKLLNGTWQYYDGSGYVGNLGTSTPNNILFQLPTSGKFDFEWSFIDTQERTFYAFNNITISGNIGQNKVNVYPLSYLDASFVAGTEIEIKDMTKNIWINKTVNSPDDCGFYLNTGYYNFNAAKATGYSDQMNDVRYISSSQTIELILYPEETETDLDKSTALFNIEYEPNLYPLTGASVTVSNSSYTETKLSSQSGTVTFELNNLTTYKILVSKTGYTSASQFFTTNSRYYYLNVVVSPGSGVITYPPTTIITTFPTTPIYGINNTVNGSVCGGNYTNIVDYFKGEIACWGVTGKESQNLLFGCIITIVAALIVGSKGKNGVGSVIGALIGFIVSIALGLFPFWLLIAAIVLSGVILFAVFRKE